MAQLKLIEKEKPVEVKTLATAAVLIDLNVSTWTGRKLDKQSTREVIANHNATSNEAATVIKKLMSDDADLKKVVSYAQDTRMYLKTHTLAWSADVRLLPSKYVIEVTSELDARIEEYSHLVQRFVGAYNTKISAAAFKLGTLFNRNEYPTADEVERKFGMRYVISPVPTSGDFRVDVQKDVASFLKDHYEKAANERLTVMMREPWERLYKTLAHAKERMDTVLSYTPQEGESARNAPKLFQSMIDNALDQANVIDKLNVTNDAQLADCAARIRRLFSNADIKSLRESKDQQASVKKQVEDILSNFDFSGFTLDE